MPEDPIFKIRQRLSSISIRKAVLYTFVCLLPFLLIPIVLGVTEIVTGIRLELLAGIIIYVVPLLLIWNAFREKDLSLAPMLMKNNSHQKDLLMVVPLMMFSLGLIWVTILILNTVDSTLAQGYLDFLNSVDFLQTSADTPIIDYIPMFVAVAILPPLLEEIVFRGSMIERLGRKYSFKTAVILSSVIFGVLHVDFIGALMFGFILSLIYLKTYSLFIPIIIHAINNGLIVLFIFADDQFLQLEPWESIESYISSAWIGILLFAISTVWLAIYLKENWHVIQQKEPIGKNSSESKAASE